MKAIRYYAYGPPEVISLEETGRPEPGDDGVLVRVRAASVNPGDWHLLRGSPYVFRAVAGLTRPKAHGLGADFAGVVEAVGKEVTRFAPGDEVYGCAPGSFAEYVTVPESGPVTGKPAGLTFEQAAAVPTSALTALQALRDKGRLAQGQKVLVNGAAGGIGTFAVQLAKAYGAEVTGVCGGGNVELVRSIGADDVIDYTRQDFTRTGRRYDVVLDNVGNRPVADCRRLLTPDGTYLHNSGSGGRWFGPMGRIIRLNALNLVVRHALPSFVTRENAADLVTLRELIEAGRLAPVVGRTHPLSEVPEAIAHVERGHARGKVVITL
ncbi:NAD(P)-dependent alcohol dehydrogenase [Nonomuraea sp. MG754425]|uniref:NAD(P)-dependent alcohol dehydrogenase n=1 Tax=Nonomuraea sp. MG754425 TaxID=2570319 RepID=UPI001F2DD3F8|nr:NAD(P)-dependent alcohol dehydrogenase [Nonomuraea sp. MG754425]MCF6469152.1 NAD(P)-dependent alcohol dehydrogenase [Nonomuraea sp. MG754425]